MPTLDFFLDLETRVWTALLSGDAGLDRALLAPEFLGVYSTGFADRDAHSGQLDGGPTIARFSLGDARLMDLGPGRVLLAYRAEYTRISADRSEAMFVSSIWEKRGADWLNIFSQDSIEGDVAPV